MHLFSGVVGPLTAALEPFLPKIELAFVFGSVAKGEDTASSDIDLMIISDSLTENAFVKRVLAQSKIWIIGRESELPTG